MIIRYLNNIHNILYIDWNIFILLKENKNLLEIINPDGYDLVYSPAHIEDLANSVMKKNIDKYITELDLEFLSNVTQNREFYPNHEDLDCNNAICLVKENPVDCFNRVIEYYDKTKLAENLNKQVLQNAIEQNYYNYETNKINNIFTFNIFKEIFPCLIIKEQFVFDYNKNILIHKKQYLYLSNKIRNLKTNNFNINNFNTNFFNLLTIIEIIEMLVDLLDNIGYWKDKIKNSYNSYNRMNDVTHIIYGVFANRFIIADKRMFQRVKAIYNFLDVKSETLFFDQNTKIIKESI